jgi:hypothetical protein
MPLLPYSSKQKDIDIFWWTCGMLSERGFSEEDFNMFVSSKDVSRSKIH